MPRHVAFHHRRPITIFILVETHGIRRSGGVGPRNLQDPPIEGEHHRVGDPLRREDESPLTRDPAVANGPEVRMELAVTGCVCVCKLGEGRNLLAPIRVGRRPPHRGRNVGTNRPIVNCCALKTRGLGPFTPRLTVLGSTRMKTAALAGLTAAFALTGCSDLTRPSTFRVSKDPAGTADQLAVAPDNLVRIPGADGKPVALPRLHPPGTPNAGKAVMAGEKVERSPRPAEH